MIEACPPEIVFTSQASAFAAADTRGWKGFYKVFPEGKHMYGIMPTNKWLARIILASNDRTYQELMRHGWPLATYWDIDAEFEEKPDNVKETRKKLIEAFHKVLADVFPSLLREPFKQHFMRWADSSGPYKGGWKLSLHATYSDPEVGWRFCHSAAKKTDPRKCLNEFVKLMIAKSTDVDELWYLEEDEDGTVHRRSMIDTKAYSSNRAMRSLGCHKPGDERVLMPLDDDFEVGTDVDKTQIRGMQTANWEPARLLSIAPCHALVVKEAATVRSATLTRHWLEKVAEQVGCVIDKVKGSLITLRTIANRRCRITGETYGKEHNRCYLVLSEGKVVYHQHGVSGSAIVEEYDTAKEFEHDSRKLRAKERKLVENFKRDHVETFVKDVVSFIDVPAAPQYVVRVDKGRRTEFTNQNLPVPFRTFEIMPAGQLWSSCGPVYTTYEEVVQEDGNHRAQLRGGPRGAPDEDSPRCGAQRHDCERQPADLQRRRLGALLPRAGSALSGL